MSVVDTDPIFVARQTELEVIRAHLAAPRGPVLTVLGAPGVGKTRIAQRYVEEPHALPALWVPLDEAQSLEALIAGLAQAFEVPVQGLEAEGIEQLGQSLEARGRCVVVLDGFEGVAAHAAIIDTLAIRAPQCRWLVTSRAALGLKAEQRLEIHPLPPSDARALFEARARLIDPAFRVDESEDLAMHRLLELLDGLPLAIELAAARVSAWSLSQLSERLRAADLAIAGPYFGPERHRSVMRAVLDSWRTLTEAEQSVLAQCSVFRGPFTIEAAEAIVDLGDHGGHLQSHLQSLREKSLLRFFRARPPVAARFAMLRVVAEVARQALEDGGAAARVRLADHYARAFERSDYASVAYGVGGVDRLVELELELDNLLYLSEALQQDRPDLAAQSGLAASYLLYVRGPGPLAKEVMDRTVRAARATGDEELLARAEVAHAAVGRQWFGRIDSVDHLQSALQVARRPGLEALAAEASAHLAFVLSDRSVENEALATLDAVPADSELPAVLRGLMLGARGHVICRAGRFQSALSAFEQAVAATSRAGAGRLEARFRRARGVCLYELRADVAGGRAEHERALAMHRHLQDFLQMPLTLANLGELTYLCGDTDGALRHLDEADRQVRRIGLPKMQGLCQSALGWIWLCEGRLDAAAEAFEEGMERSRRAWPIIFPRCLGGLAVVRLAAGDVSQARGLLEETLQLRAGKEGTFSEAPFEEALLGLTLRVLEGAAEGERRIEGARAQAATYESTRLRAAVACIEAAVVETPDDWAPLDGVSSGPTEVYPLVRAARSVLERLGLSDAPVLRLDKAGRFAVLPNGDRVDLARKPTLARLVIALSRRGARPVEALVEDVWPGDQSGAEAMSNRLWVALSNLRKLGFAELIERSEEGYGFVRDLRIELE